MTKLVLKTVAITLVAVLGAGMILFGSLALFAPLSVANFFDGMGMYKPAVKFYERQYGKSEDIDDLAVLILKINQETDSIKTEEYLKIMIERTDYSNFCQEQDLLVVDGQVSTDEFYKGKYAVSLVRNDKFSMAVEVANEFVADNGYTDYNPFSVVIVELGKTLSDEQLSVLKCEISEHINGQYANVALKDINAIKQLLR